MLIANAPVTGTLPSLIPFGASLYGYTNNIYNFNPQLSDLSFTTTPSTFLYSGVVGINSPSSVPDASHFAMIGGVFAMKQLGDGVSVNMSTQKINSTQGLAPYCLGSKGFYMQATVQVPAYTQDAHIAVWTLPQEHNLQNPPGDVLSIPPAPVGTINYEGYGEIDFAESSFGSYPQDLNTLWDHHGIFSGLPAVASTSQTVANPGVFHTASQSYPAGLGGSLKGTAPGGFSLSQYYFVLASGLTSTTFQLGLAPGGPAIACTSSASCTFQPGYQNIEQTNTNLTPHFDYTQPHRFGGGYNPTNKVGYMTVDDILQATYSTAAFDYEYEPYHWPFNFSAQTRGLNTPYNMLISNIQVWTPP